MRRTIALLFILFSIKCTNKSEIISSNGIRSIVITPENTNKFLNSSQIEIRNEDSLKQVIGKINQCEREPIIFYPTHRLKVTYKDGQEKIILCSGSSMKLDGLTYRLKAGIKDIVGIKP